MSDAVAVEIAKAVTVQIAAATFSQTFTPERSYAEWDVELKDEDELHVDVVVVTTEQTADLSSQSTVKYLVPVDIGVRKKFGPDKQNDDTGRIQIESVDELVLLVQEIHELFTPQRLTGFDPGVWQETKIVVSPATKHLREMRQFTGIVRVTFRVDRKVV
jgi:hypothetical protein